MNGAARRPPSQPKVFKKTKFLCTYCGGRTVENDLSKFPKEIRRMEEPNIIQGLTVSLNYAPIFHLEAFICPWCVKKGLDEIFGKKVSVLLTGKEVDSTKEKP